VSARAHIGLETKLASALLALGHIPYNDAKQMTARQICSLYQFDHGILHAIKPINDFWNLTPRLIAPHRAKSRKDTGIVAKVKALSEEHEDFRRKVLARPCGQKRERSGRWASRKMQSRGFQRGRP
jgi:hypothetical protein